MYECLNVFHEPSENLALRTSNAVVQKGSKAEKGHGGQPAPKTVPEAHAKGAKKKKAESPKLGHSTFSKLFRHKVGMKL